MARLLASLVLVGLLVAPARSADEDAKLLLGNWKVVAVTIEGKPQTNDELEKAKPRLTITDKMFQMKEGDEIKQEAPYTIDATKSPKQLNLVFGTNVMNSIFEVSGDKLRICSPSSPAHPGRPTDFKSEASGHTTLLEFEREKP